MTDAEIVDKTAKLLFTCDEHGEVDPWKVYDKLEALFAVHRLSLKQKYESSLTQQIIKEKEQKIQELKDKYQYYEDNRNMTFHHSAHQYYNMIPSWIEGLQDYLTLNQNKDKDE